MNTTTGIVVTPTQMGDLYRAAYFQITDAADRDGPIECIVPWQGVGFYMLAIEFMTGEKPEAIPHGGEMFRLRGRGYRAIQG